MLTLSETRHAIAVSGDVISVMLVLLFIALTVTLERYCVLRRMASKGEALLRSLRSMSTLSVEALRPLVDGTGTLPHAALVRTMLETPGARDHSRVGEQLEEAVMHELPSVDRGLWILDTIVTLAPLLGLLGTIIGMFNTFHALGHPGAAQEQVTSGVGEALLATACGLLIAILGLIAFNFLNQKVRLIVHQLERTRLVLLNRYEVSP